MNTTKLFYTHESDSSIMLNKEKAEVNNWPAKYQSLESRRSVQQTFCNSFRRRLGKYLAAAYFLRRKPEQSNMINSIENKPSLWEKLSFGAPALARLGSFRDVPVLAPHG